MTEEEEFIEAVKNIEHLKDIADELHDIKRVLLEIADTLSIGLLREKSEGIE